jgi:DNA-binding response OmpR family regulator
MGKTILVVEDDFDTIHPLSELLRLKGYDVITASAAGAAFELARARRPGLIITDIALPGGDGVQLINKVRSHRAISSTPIIVISGCGAAALIEAAAAGADFCLEKPLDIDCFWGAITQALNEEAAVATDEARERSDRQIIAEIDGLVEALRSCFSKEDREAHLRRLKQCIAQLQGRETE